MESSQSSSAPPSPANLRPQLGGLPLYECRPEDEFLHPPAVSGHYSSTETTYWGFNIPEKNLNGEIYMWFHPVLRMCSASVYIWKGFHRSTLSCEYVNHYHYLPYPEDGIADYRVSDAMDLRFRVIEPLKTIEIEYRDADRGVALTLLNQAIMPPAGRPGGYHFTQAMKVTGTLDLFGEMHVIDGYFSRDHSWSQERRETSRVGPPLTWMVGVFGDDLAFHAVGYDEPSLRPGWEERYPAVKAGQGLGWGFIFKDGTTKPLKSMRKLTHREPDGLSPVEFEVELIDIDDAVHIINGQVQARMPWQTWQNMNVYFCQTQWEYAGRTGYGDAQDIQMNDFVHHFAKRDQ